MHCIVCSLEGDSDSKTGYCVRWKICNYCYTNTLGLLDDDEDAYKLHHLPYTNAYFHLSDETPITPGLLRLIKKLKESSDMVDFLRQKYPPDVHFLPGSDHGLPIPAHTKFLAARSNVFKNMLDDDGLMDYSGNDPIVLAELSRDELNCFLEFLYKGRLSQAKLLEHSKALFTAAHKFDVPSLAESLLKELNIENVLGVLEISHPYSIQRSKEIALKFIVKNKEKILSTPAYADFSNKNRDLSLEIQSAISGYRDIRQIQSAISGYRDIRLVCKEVKRHGDRLYKIAAIIFFIYNFIYP